ncbi:Tox-REase-5 domain-containing protein [Cystobacter fuscus]|nr:Tox-REase-5 domain-containing protein [Cystobacter fuscus]
MIGELEFDGIRGKELLEAKGPGYCSFFNPDGTPKYWYKNSGKFDQLMTQAGRQAKLAHDLGLPLTWHVADAKVAEFLRKEFVRRRWHNTTIHHTSLTR